VPKDAGAAQGKGVAASVSVVQAPDADEELAARQSALREEAAALLEEVGRSGIFTDVGRLAVTGSYVSELMCWRDLDVMLLVGPRYSPRDVVQLISRAIERLEGVVGFDYRDERAGRSPTGHVRDERYHLPFLLERGAGIWRLDLTLWLHDLHENLTSWHLALRDSMTDEQRAGVLRIKDASFRLPSYPDQISGFEIYTAVMEEGVRTPEQFRGWLADRGFSFGDGPIRSPELRPGDSARHSQH
jgi:hypothetical protein